MGLDSANLHFERRKTVRWLSLLSRIGPFYGCGRCLWIRAALPFTDTANFIIYGYDAQFALRDKEMAKVVILFFATSRRGAGGAPTRAFSGPSGGCGGGVK